MVRAPDERFAALPDWPYVRREVLVPAGPTVPEVATLSVAYIDEGPRDAAPVLLVHGEPSWSFLYRSMIPVLVAAGHRVVAPDLVGFQEVLAVQYDAIAERLPGHAFAGVGRDDGLRRGEFSSVGFRRDRFTAVASGTFWLSETPEVPGSKSWDAALPRICPWVRLRETATGRELVFANTHFDHRGKVARQEAARVLSERLGPIAAGVPAILTGDFNINEEIGRAHV